MLGHRNYFLFFALFLLALAWALAGFHLDATWQAVIYAQPAWLAPLMRAFTRLGSWLVLLVVLLMALALAYRQLQGETGLRIAAATVISAAVVQSLKVAVDRARPAVPHLTSSNGGSFPSGHSLDSVVVYGLVGMALLRFVPRARRWAPALFAVPVLVGWSRVFLGVHWPSDVVGGWGIGLLIFSLAAGTRPGKTSAPAAPRRPEAIEPQRVTTPGRPREADAASARKRA